MEETVLSELDELMKQDLTETEVGFRQMQHLITKKKKLFMHEWFYTLGTLILNSCV